MASLSPSLRFQSAKILSERIHCTLGEAFSLLSGKCYKGLSLDYWQYEFQTANESRESQEESAHRAYVSTHRL